MEISRKTDKRAAEQKTEVAHEGQETATEPT